MEKLLLISNDPLLTPYEKKITEWHELALSKEKQLTGAKMLLSDFSNGYLYFGLHRTSTGWVFREWAPNASKMYLIGEFSGWQEKEDFLLQKKAKGVWELQLAADILKHGMLYRLSVHWPGGRGDRIPAWTRKTHQDTQTNIFNAQVWDTWGHYQWKHKSPIGNIKHPLIYEAHVGMATEEEKVGSFVEFKNNVLPHIVKAGYNTIQLMAIQEHPYYGSFGYHVSNFFAVSSRFGTPEELKELIDEAHGLGLAVILDIVHSHAVKNEIEGLGNLDGSKSMYFHINQRREHVAWDSLCFDYGKNEVLHFLLSNCKYWLEEFKFDGFRFDGVTSMLYYDHGLSRNFTSYRDYFDGNQDVDAIVYLMLANKLIHQVNKDAITIAEEMSGMPGLGAPFANGGIGFDYRMAMGTPDYWIKIIKELPDEKWNVSAMYYELTNRRNDERTIGYVESHDQALVGDKTIIFQLLDKEMYYNMAKEKRNLLIDRGLALHKMIRLITATTAGAGYLNFMGNEFGHPEWIDFPRQGNNWSYKYARRQWSLVRDNTLCYQYLLDFDKAMITLIKQYDIFSEPYPYKIHENLEAQVLAYTRKDLVFIFNFNPTTSFTDYAIPIKGGKYRIILNTDFHEFGGQELVDANMTYFAIRDNETKTFFLKIYIPSRSALVLQLMPTKRLR